MFAFLLAGESVPAELWVQIPLNESAVHLRLSQEPLLATTDLLLALAQQGYSRKELTGTLTNDPISTAAALGNRPTALDWVQCVGGIKNTADCPNFRSLGLDLSYIHERGGTLAEELSTALLTIVETLDQLGEQGYEVSALLPKLALTFGVGNHFFLEIAKFRAFRLLMSQLLRAYEVEEQAASMPFVMAQTSLRLQSQAEPLDNLLPATTQAMSAIFGGVDALFVQPCDAISNSETAETTRLARNVQQLLRHESQLHQVQDPVGGSYYLEVATHQLAEAAWKLFQEK
jgi:methylmalonyl-CoA mutase